MPTPGGGVVDVVVSYRNVIVLSQSCDLDQRKLEFVLVAPYVGLEQAKAQYDYLRGSDKREALRQGNQVGLHPLNRCEIRGYETDYLVVDFRQVFTAPLAYAFAKAAKPVTRLRLLPPYREHLAQAYARFIMRVGLPVDIPRLP
jgi:hypothetical protein